MEVFMKTDTKKLDHGQTQFNISSPYLIKTELAPVEELIYYLEQSATH
jgi:hypothetical protein